MMLRTKYSMFDTTFSKWYIPDKISDYQKQIFDYVQTLQPVCNKELLLLKLNYDGDPALIENLFHRPQSWDNSTWAMAQTLQVYCNTTKSSVNTLTGYVYGGKIVRETERDDDRLVEVLESQAWEQTAIKAFQNCILYGWCAVSAIYDPRDGFKFFVHDSPYTHVLYDGIKFIGIAESIYEDSARIVSTCEGIGTISKTQISDSSWTQFAYTLEQPYTILLDFGKSFVRESPGFNKNLSTILWGASIASRAKLNNILVYFSDNESSNLRSENIGTDVLLRADSNDKFQQISSGASVADMVNGVQPLITLENTMTGTPNSDAIRSGQSAAATELLTSSVEGQLEILRKYAISNEYKMVELCATILGRTRGLKNVSRKIVRQTKIYYEDDVVDEDPQGIDNKQDGSDKSSAKNSIGFSVSDDEDDPNDDE